MYLRHCTPISIKIGQHLLKLCTKVFWCVFMTHSVELIVMERRLWWFGHVLRMDEDRLARQALQWELDTARWKANRSGKTGATLYASRSKGYQYVEI